MVRAPCYPVADSSLSLSRAPRMVPPLADSTCRRWLARAAVFLAYSLPMPLYRATYAFSVDALLRSLSAAPTLPLSRYFMPAACYTQRGCYSYSRLLPLLYLPCATYDARASVRRMSRARSTALPESLHRRRSPRGLTSSRSLVSSPLSFAASLSLSLGSTRSLDPVIHVCACRCAYAAISRERLYVYLNRMSIIRKRIFFYIYLEPHRQRGH